MVYFIFILVSLAKAALATVAIELIVLWLMLERRRKVLLSSVVMNICTNVPLNLYLMNSYEGLGTVIILELVVIAVESLCYYLVTRQPLLSLKYGVICNVVSYSLGVVAQFNYSSLGTQ